MLTEKNKNTIKRVVLVGIFLIIFMAIGTIMLKYEVEGEKNKPFNLTKISLVSTVTGIHKDNADQYWNLDLIQNNDLYLNFEKNNINLNDALIKRISLENIDVIKQPKIGDVKFYKTSNNISNIYENKEENSIVDKIEYTGETQSNLEDLKIGNQGGIVGIRCSIQNLGEYASNNTEIRVDGSLLKGKNITTEELNMELSFDIILELTTGIKYKAKAKIDLPCGNIVEEGICKKEITDLKNIVFKRF